MSNLGMYQTLTTMAKKVGGPKIFIALLASGSAILGGGAFAVGTAIKNKVNSVFKKKRQDELLSKFYTVIKEGRSKEGLLFEEGDTYKVLEVDGDACLIEKTGDENNPYYVSRRFLSSISDFLS